MQENIDLRATVDILHTTQEAEEGGNNNEENRGGGQRKPRNFLASTVSSGGGIFTKRIVAFDAYRNSPFDKEQATVTYDGTSVNAGHGLNISSGLFTAPYPGTYAFNFHALTRDGTATYVKIMKNGRNVGGAYRRHEGEGDETHETNQSVLI